MVVVYIILLGVLGLLICAVTIQSKNFKDDLDPLYETIRQKFELLATSITYPTLRWSERFINHNLSLNFYLDYVSIRPLVSGYYSHRTVNVWRHVSYLGIVIETEVSAPKKLLKSRFSRIWALEIEPGYRLEKGRMCRLLLE